MLLAVAVLSHSRTIELPDSLLVAPAREQIVDLLGTPTIGLADAVVYEAGFLGLSTRALFLVTDGTIDQAVLSIGSDPRSEGQPERAFSRIAKALRVRYGPAEWEIASTGSAQPGAIAAGWNVDGAFIVHRLGTESGDHSLTVTWRSARERFNAPTGLSLHVHQPAQLIR